METPMVSQPKRLSVGKVRRLYHQKYREDWEKFPSFASWLCRSADGCSAHCKVCDANVLARLASIKQHHNTAKHQKAIKNYPFGQKPFSRGGAKAQKVVRNGKPKPKIIKRIKAEKVDQILEPMDPDTCSNDSLLEDLLGSDDMEPQYLHEMNDEEAETDDRHEPYQECKYDDYHDDNTTEENIINEFDLFGKSVSLQLNHMELEDALLCQERLQVVLTEFRLKILKRKAKRNF
ncbi:uncharacterized protein LOC117781541 isoform X2 [Drosophila innubila]|uniref:uncharacterized protein LOC117781541 isoform X2 n=1 Tax=Drosophila innubila TaxID=198719 RepID=UPI00148E1A0C|nr:uncharacterized protein LOC117781541 isoform X2 [Drosophila innubila]